MNPTARSNAPAAGPGSPLSRGLHGLAIFLLLACLVARCFLGELPYRRAMLRKAMGFRGDSEAAGAFEVDRLEQARMAFAVLLVAALAAWLLGGAVGGRLRIRHAPLALLILAFAALSLVSALRASNVRAALEAWIEQVAILSAAFLAVQLCADRRRFALVVVVVAAVGLTLAARGLWETFVEIPDRIAQLEQNRDRILAEAGVRPGTPQARAYETRMRAVTPIGFFGLSNLFASLLVLTLLPAAGLAADKIAAAFRSRKPRGTRPKRGEVHLPSIAAGLTAVGAAAVAAVLVRTGSQGAMLSGIVGLLAAAGICAFRRRLARHWKAALTITAAAFLLATAAMTAYGLKYDRLPTKTMTFRWYYWTASAQMVRHRPLLGVGPGNFASTYLHYRGPEAEEAVKMPHNFAMHAAAQFGLPGGLCYLAILAYVLVGMARPAAEEHRLAKADKPAPLPRWTFLGIVAAAVAAKMAWGSVSAEAYPAVVEVALPAAALAVSLLVAGWLGAGFAPSADVPSTACRIGLACGVGAFVLHNMVTISLWVPATALALATAGGAALGRTRSRPLALSRLRWPVAIAALAATAAAALLLYLPVHRRTNITQRALRSLQADDLLGAIRHAKQAAAADPLDPVAAAEVADLIQARSPRTADWGRLRRSLAPALGWAKQAIERDPANYAYYRRASSVAQYLAWPDAFVYSWRRVSGSPGLEQKLEQMLQSNPGNPMLLSDLAGLAFARGEYSEAARLCRRAIDSDPNSSALRENLGAAAWRAGDAAQARGAWRRAAELAGDAQEALALMAQAIARDPTDTRLRLSYAELLCSAGRPAQCLAQLARAEQGQWRLLPESFCRFNEAEWRRVEMLKASANALMADPTTAPQGPSPPPR